MALGALIVLVGVAFYSGREKSEQAVGSDLPANVQAPSTRLTETLPPVAPPGTGVTAVAQDVAMSPQARLMAERFKCICGCNLILATCTCGKTPGSRDMKKYLQTLVDEGKSPADIERDMIARYGDEVIP